MTNNPKIEDASPHPYGYIQNPMREDFEHWAAEESEVRGVGETIGLSTDEHHDRYSMIWTQTSWIAWQASQAAKQSTIARLEARITQLESEVEFAAATYQAARDRIAELENGRSEPVLFVAAESIGDQQCVGMHATRKANDLQCVPLFTAQPAPAAVELPTTQELREIVTKSAREADLINGANYYTAAELAAGALFEKIKELNP